MSHHTPPARSLALAVAITLSGGLAAHGVAQESPRGIPALPDAFSSEAGASRDDDDPWRASLDVEFVGGSVADYVALLRGASSAAGKGDPNIVIADPRLAATTMVPTVRLRSVLLSTALEILTRLVDAREADLDVDHVGPDTVVIELRSRSKSQGPELTVLPLSAILEGEGRPTLDAVLGALEEALELVAGEGGKSATVRYHVDTKLLFVFGSSRDAEAARQVIESLQPPAVTTGAFGSVYAPRALPTPSKGVTAPSLPSSSAPRPATGGGRVSTHRQPATSAGVLPSASAAAAPSLEAALQRIAELEARIAELEGDGAASPSLDSPPQSSVPSRRLPAAPPPVRPPLPSSDSRR